MRKLELTPAQLHSTRCAHVGEARTVSYGEQVCPECVALGDTWVHLRICMLCGHVGCCDNSKNKHATAHFKKTGHPLIKSIEPNEDWAWCYVDQLFLE